MRFVDTAGIRNVALVGHTGAGRNDRWRGVDQPSGNEDQEVHGVAEQHDAKKNPDQCRDRIR